MLIIKKLMNKDSSINYGGVSKCCSAPIKADCADEGTCCFVCQKCFKAADIKKSMNIQKGR